MLSVLDSHPPQIPPQTKAACAKMTAFKDQELKCKALCYLLHVGSGSACASLTYRLEWSMMVCVIDTIATIVQRSSDSPVHDAIRRSAVLDS